MDAKAINPLLIHRFHRDLTAEELGTIRKAIELVPGSEEGRREIWEQFERNEVTAGICRDTEGALAFFVFFEVRTGPEGRIFYARAAKSLLPSRTLAETTFPQLENFARQLECRILSVQTARPGMVGKLLKMPGYRMHDATGGEVILRKIL
jgi:hypothetical protein